MSRARSTSPDDCPQQLAPGDVVEASFKQHYLQWIVREVRDLEDDKQQVLASYPGRGSLRFVWSGGHCRDGHGHGMRFYFVRRPEGPIHPPLPTDERAWLSMSSAPKDGTEVLLLVERRAGIPGRCLVGHYMPGGHCIEDHPPVSQGWYFWNGLMFDIAANPIGWLPIPRNR